MRRFKQMPLPPSQLMLYGQSVDDMLSSDSDVRSFDDVMECLDYRVFESKCSELGCPPYPPKVMVKILCYAYSKGLRSSRKIEDSARNDVRYIWLAGGLRPDHNTIARFRKDNWSELEHLFKDSIRVCAEAGLVLLNVVSIDGTKIEAAASRKQVYGEKRLNRQLEAVETILREAEEVDREEDRLYGDGRPQELPEHLRDAKARRAKLRQIAERLKESGKKGVVETEPESRVMKTGDGKRPAYNLQAAVDSEKQVIVGMKLIQAENDHGQLPAMVQELESNTGLSADVCLADCGYADEGTLVWVEETKHNVLMPLQESSEQRDENDLFASRCFVHDADSDVLICPAGRTLLPRLKVSKSNGAYVRYRGSGCQSCSFCRQCVRSGRGSRYLDVSAVWKQRSRMLERLAEPDAKQLYELRKQTVEPVFGQMKHNQGFNRLITWGLHGAIAETALACIAHNVMKCVAKAATSAQLAVSRSLALLLCSLVRRFRPLGLQAA